ncbi:MAG TPA: tetratricopeptide repeat protein [Pirellulales bacterium]|nr:tetratricopeptide repeat protein [Pirellulales bacterium]
MKRMAAMGMVWTAVALVAPNVQGQVYSYGSGVRNRVIQGGPLGPAPLDPYSVSSYFGWLPSPIVARQTVGHQFIPTGPNGYVYRPIYADELDERQPSLSLGRSTSSARQGSFGQGSFGQGSFGQGSLRQGSFLARHAAAPADAQAPLQPAAFPLAAGAQPPANPADDAFAAALADVRRGEYDLALDALQSVLDRDPRRGDAESLAAQALFALGDYPGSLAALSRAIDRLPEAEWDRYVAGYRRYFPSALQYIVRLRLLERYVDDRPDDATGPVLLGFHYGALGFADDALRLLRPVQDHPVAKPLFDHFARRRAANDGPPPAPEDAVVPEAEDGPREF